MLEIDAVTGVQPSRPVEELAGERRGRQALAEVLVATETGPTGAVSRQPVDHDAIAG